MCYKCDQIKEERCGPDKLATMGRKKNAYGFLWKNHRDRNHLGDQGLDERVILKQILNK
jgi:hypothetical protein